MKTILPPQQADKRPYYDALLAQLGVREHDLRRLELDEQNQLIRATHMNGAQLDFDLKANQQVARAALCNLGTYSFCARRQEPHRTTAASVAKPALVAA